MTDSIPTCSSAPHTRRRRGARVLFACAPLLLWLAAIAVASTNIASSAHTDVILWRLVHLFSPDTPGGDSFASNHHALVWGVRKTAHLVEYGVFGLLAAYAVKGVFPDYAAGHTRRALSRMTLVVLPLGVVVASIDELHQTSLPSRTGALGDVAFDVVGLSAGLLGMWLLGRRRNGRGVDGRPSGRRADCVESD